MVVLAAAFGFCYGCAAVAESTRLLQFEKEVTVERIAFFFGTGVGGDKCDGWSVLRWEGGSPSVAATVMVRVFRVQIPTAACVDACTVEGVLLE